VSDLLNILEPLLLPPASGLIAALLGLLLWPRAVAKMLTLAGLAWIYVAATPLFAGLLLQGLENGYEIAPPVPADAGAIVVLAGGRYRDTPEYGGETVNHHSLERLRYAARLHRETGLPVLVSGGRVRGDEPRAEADLVAAVLEEDLGVRVRWRETVSRNTRENAAFSAAMLASAGIDHALLVTHALHMPRAAWSFGQAGFTVTPFPTLRMGDMAADRAITVFLPSPRALWLTGQALHEYLGLAWYRLGAWLRAGD
jgi:uncharacterized SAM-binding protein YcdF (DUF218 family)